jgi:hypothetical protein
LIRKVLKDSQWERIAPLLAIYAGAAPLTSWSKRVRFREITIPLFILNGDIAIVEISHTLGTTLGRIGGKALLGA